MTEKDAADQLRLCIESLIKDINNPYKAPEIRITTNEVSAMLKAFLKQHDQRRQMIPVKEL
jgi:hypothetical protein